MQAINLEATMEKSHSLIFINEGWKGVNLG